MTKKEMIATIIKEEEKAWEKVNKEKNLMGKDYQESYAFQTSASVAIALCKLAKKLEIVD